MTPARASNTIIIIPMAYGRLKHETCNFPRNAGSSKQVNKQLRAPGRKCFTRFVVSYVCWKMQLVASCLSLVAPERHQWPHQMHW